MPFPAGLTLVSVHGRFDTLPSGGASGTARFIADYPLTGAADNSIVPPFTVSAGLDVNGECTVSLPATNDPGWVPTGWAYRVVVNAGTVTLHGTLQLDYLTTSVELSDLIQWDGAAVAGTTYATLAQLTSAEATAAAATAAVATDLTELSRGLWRPTDQNLVGWTFDPAGIQGGTQLASAGLAYVLRIQALAPVITNIEIEIETAGSGLSNCFALVTNDAGATIGDAAITADQATAWQSTGRKKMPLVGAQGVTPGAFYRAVLVGNGSNLPSVARAAAGVDPNTLNSDMTAPTLRWSTANSGVIALPSPASGFNLSAQTAIGTAFWGAFS